jgi:cytochrome c2
MKIAKKNPLQVFPGVKKGGEIADLIAYMKQPDFCK